MSTSSLHPELLDHIADHLHDKPATLRACCLVSKSWIPRTRRYLFFHVSFYSSEPFNSWMRTFPDPSNSPACYTRSLRLASLEVLTVAVSDAFPWVRSFNRILELEVSTRGEGDGDISFTRLHGLSSTLKSLQLYYFFAPPPEVINFVCSFPALEPLSLCSPEDLEREKCDDWDTPPTSPRFTGSLFLHYNDRQITRKLPDLPGGLHFSNVSVLSFSQDGDLVKKLVSKCSDSLESLCVEFDRGAFSTISVVDRYLIALCRCTLSW